MRKALLVAMGVLASLLALVGCARSGDRVVYQYKETAVLFDDFQIKKTVYTPGKMKLYYKGVYLKDNQITCYDANFEDLGSEFEHAFQNGVLTVKADFADKISGLTIEDRDHDTIYHLRYLDSPQFAWLADTFWYDAGWMEMGDEEKYYTAEERQEQQNRVNAVRQETMEVFSLLEGTWFSEDGSCKIVCSMDEDGTGFVVDELQLDETDQTWKGYSVSVESAYQTQYEDADDGSQDIVEFTLVNRDHAAANTIILYDRQNNTLRDGEIIYHKQ